MHVDQLFWHTLGDLETRLRTAAEMADGSRRTSTEDYNVLLISGLLRKLLLDERPLVHVVNRSYHLPLSFEVEFWPILSGTAVGESVGAITISDVGSDIPVVPLADPSRHLTISELLRSPVLYWNEYAVTARDLIRHVAHVEGGVHTFDPDTDASSALRDFSQSVIYGGFPLALRGLVEVGRIVVRGLVPLKDAVEAGPHPPNVPELDTRTGRAREE